MQLMFTEKCKERTGSIHIFIRSYISTVHVLYSTCTASDELINMLLPTKANTTHILKIFIYFFFSFL
jgi:hypothetical protein